MFYSHMYCVCAHICLCAYMGEYAEMSAGARGGQKGASNFLWLQLLAVLSCLIWAL